jgi:protoporphyrinogen oxidase
LATEETPVGALISTMPITELVERMDPPAPPAVLDAARALRYRSIITANLILSAREVLPDTWVYLHEPALRAGRLQLYKNWSPAMVPDAAMSSLGFEYFAFEGDDLWRLPDAEILAMASGDLAQMPLPNLPRAEDGFVVRYAKAYPVYDLGYRRRVETIRAWLAGFGNLACAGRYGQFRYNNMDHSIVTAQLAVRRLLGDEVDPWAVNEDAEYQEELRT